MITCLIEKFYFEMMNAKFQNNLKFNKMRLLNFWQKNYYHHLKIYKKKFRNIIQCISDLFVKVIICKCVIFFTLICYMNDFLLILKQNKINASKTLGIVWFIKTRNMLKNYFTFLRFLLKYLRIFTKIYYIFCPRLI